MNSSLASVSGDLPVAFSSMTSAFADVLGDQPRLVRVAAVEAHEGPVYAPDEDALYFTTVPRKVTFPAPGLRDVSIVRLSLDGDRFPLGSDRLATVRSATNMANGMALDGDRLLVCEQGTLTESARIAALDPRTGAEENVVDHFAGRRLCSPNDVVVASDGSIWFTDPTYGYLQDFRPPPELGDAVYRYDPRTERLTQLTDVLEKPNGLAFSPDERVLYVTDSGANQQPGTFHVGLPHQVVAFDVIEGSQLAAGRVFAVTNPGYPDGIKVDTEGRVYVSSFTGVQVFDDNGALLGEIRLPGAVNFAFGGPHRNILFITTDTAVWAAVLAARGANTPRSAIQERAR
jgi:gluconolactonase